MTHKMGKYSTPLNIQTILIIGSIQNLFSKKPECQNYKIEIDGLRAGFRKPALKYSKLEINYSYH